MPRESATKRATKTEQKEIMAHLQECKYCHRQVVSASWHPECRAAKLEDLLHKIQLELQATGIKNASLANCPALVQEILDEKFRSKEEIDRNLGDQKQRLLVKELWKLERHEALQKLDAEWQKEHPDPDPPTY